MFVVVFPVITHVQRHLAIGREWELHATRCMCCESEDDNMPANTIAKIDIFSVLGRLFSRKIAVSDTARYKFDLAR